MKKAFLKLDEIGWDIIMFYIYSFNFGIIIFVFYAEPIEQRFSLTMFLQISKNSKENTCTGVSFLSAANNFINKEYFPKSLTIFAKSSIVDIWLGYKCASVLTPDLQILFSVEVSDKNYYRVILTP